MTDRCPTPGCGPAHKDCCCHHGQTALAASQPPSGDAPGLPSWREYAERQKARGKPVVMQPDELLALITPPSGDALRDMVTAGHPMHVVRGCDLCDAREGGEPRKENVCPICERVIVKESHGGPNPSAGDHDPARHVALAYKETPRD